MSLVTVLRSPSTSASDSLGDSEVDEDQEDSSLNRSRASSFEGFFASKGAAYALPDGDFARRATKHGGEMQLHLQAMVNLLRDEDVLRLVVKLESQYPNRIRYLTIVSAFGPDEEEQSIVMGVDWIDKATIGLVVPLYRDTTLKLDGDGGFKMSSAGNTNIFKPISVQTMWTALQWIHKCSDIARRNNYFYPNGSSHAWVEYYYRKITSDRFSLKEWHQMEDIESRRPESPIGTSPEKEIVMKLIRHKLREVMAKVDLEEVTSRQVRNMLEEDTQMELREYRSFIEEEMFTILGQMDSASKIFDHVYLGSEWNASNLEELKENGVGYILNITREIDNFFPGTFCYHNIRVYDLDDTELLHHWDNTYKFIQRARNAGSKVLVHCRMGISRSASTVIAYGMKEYGWSLGDTMKYVKARRSVVQPNQGFWKQLITYEGILNSSKQRYNKLFTSKLEPAETATPRKRKKIGNTTNKTSEQLAQEEDMDNVYDLLMETEPLETSEETSPDSGVVRILAEDTADAVIASEAVSENRDADSAEMACLSTSPAVESSDEIFGETDSFRVLEIRGIEKTSPKLHRVRSVPALPSDDKTMQTGGNFQRSNSLRERGPRKVEQLRAMMEGKSASDGNMTGCGLKKASSFESNVKSLVDDPSYVETKKERENHGSLPRELHGVLESGFVKRESKKFEDGVYNVPSVMQVTEDNEKPEEKIIPECEASEGEQASVEEEPSESMPSEEPEPGVVKKHKEGYELKHSESLKRGTVLRRGGSEEGSTLKRDTGEMCGESDSEAEEASQVERLSSVKIEALVKKVNEDMKKEVSIRRTSKKELEQQAFVHQAGELIENSLDNCEMKTGVGSRESLGIFSFGGIETDLESTQKSAECVETPLSNRRNGHSIAGNEDQSREGVREDVELSDVQQDAASKEDQVESIPQQGLVKRHTLLIEGRLQPFGQTSDKQAEGKDETAGETEGEPKVDSEGNLGLALAEGARGSTVESETLQERVEEDRNAIVTTSLAEGNKSDLSKIKEDRGGKDIPQKGLVKRHTLLIEGKLNTLEQVSVKDYEKEASEDSSKNDQDTRSRLVKDEIRGTASASQSENEDIRVDVMTEGEGMENENVAGGRTERCEVFEDRQDVASEEDLENILQKGLVKRHTLLIEERLQPVAQEMHENDKCQDEKKDELNVYQEAGPSLLVPETRGEVVDSEQVEMNVAQDVQDQGKISSDKNGTGRAEQSFRGTSSSQDGELPAERGLVKRHTLLIEGKLQPFDQVVEGEDGQRDEAIEVCTSVELQQRYQIERASKGTAEEGEEENRGDERASGLVEREKIRIEERVNPVVAEAISTKQERRETMTAGNEATTLKLACGGREKCGEDEDFREDDLLEDRVREKEQDEVGVDTSSVVRVKDHTQHLEAIICVTTTPKDVEKPKRQTWTEDFPGSSKEPLKLVVVRRSCSDDQIAQEAEPSSSDKLFEDRMQEILSDSAVNIALLKAQEGLELENETSVDWHVANVKQRTRVFEEILRHLNNDREGENPIRRCESLPRTIHPSEKYALRRRSFSDLTETVSSSSGREVGYIIQFSNGESSSSSSLPRDWNPLLQRQQKEACEKGRTVQVLSPEIFRDGELIDCRDGQNDSFSVKEKIQVLDSKNQRNITNVSQ